MGSVLLGPFLQFIHDTREHAQADHEQEKTGMPSLPAENVVALNLACRPSRSGLPSPSDRLQVPLSPSIVMAT